MERRLDAILAADVVGYSRMMGEDEVGTLGRLYAANSVCSSYWKAAFANLDQGCA